MKRVKYSCLLIGLLMVLSGCGVIAQTFEDLNPLPFFADALYPMYLGPSELSVDENGEVVSGSFYFLHKDKTTTAHYRVTYQKSDGVAKAIDLKDAPFEGTNSGYLMQLRRVLIHLIDEFSGKAMQIQYVPLGYNQKLDQYAGLYYHGYHGDQFVAVTAETAMRYSNYLEVTVDGAVYFVALGTNELN